MTFLLPTKELGGGTGTELAPFKGRKPGTAVQSCLVVVVGGGAACAMTQDRC